jgi:COP9 signalosome complex subunit 1
MLRLTTLSSCNSQIGHEDLGRHYYLIGDLPESHKSYQRMRDYCTSQKHVADMCLRLTLVCISQQSWMQAQSQISKVEALSLAEEEKQALRPIIDAVSGLLNMCGREYREAAEDFLSTSYAFATAEPASGITWQKAVLTANDVAVYGGLCALASMDRSALQRRVLNNTEFRQFLELEPHIRRAIDLFCKNKYSSCLDVLEGYRTDYALDLYLNPLLTQIYSKIRSKCIVQYFIPYSCVSLDEMAKAFETEGSGKIEEELLDMIRSGTLNARVDLVDRVSDDPCPKHIIEAYD